MKLPFTVPNEQPRNSAWEIKEIVGTDLMLCELISWLSHDDLNAFLTDFCCHLEAGDFNDLLNTDS